MTRVEGALLAQSASEIVRRVHSGATSAAAECERAIEAAKRADLAGLNALVARHESKGDLLASADGAGRAAAERRHPARGRRGGALAGVVLAVADDVAELALPTTAGSRALAGYVSPFEATAVARVLDAGALILGKTNVAEFGIGRDTSTSAFGATRHPDGDGRDIGGASAGLAVAVAAGLVPAGLGVDAAGDLRVPAARCGVCAIKPTYGRVSRVGAFTHAPSLAVVGSVGRTVDDAALVLEVAAGRDPLDPTSADLRVVIRTASGPTDDGRPLRGIRIGRVAAAFAQAHTEVAAAAEAALVSLRDLGAEVRNVTLAAADLVEPTYRVISAVEAASALARYDGVRFGPRFEAGGVRALVERSRGERLSAVALDTVLLGTHLAGWPNGRADADTVLARAQAARARIAQRLVDHFKTLDLLVAPALLDELAPDAAPADRRAVDHADALMLAVNLAGLPAAVVPIGPTAVRRASLHFVGAHFAEATIVRAAAALERLAAAESRT